MHPCLIAAFTMSAPFVQSLLHWYRRNARQLPWRGHPDPYAVWVSEIMLQQTRVDTVIPYFERWLERFPTLHSLAAAEQQAVLNQWEGLGYYSRARNLHRAAQIVVEQHAGKLPADVKALQKLPGIGRYTAGAIASICFGLDTPALDGNIRRVMARLFNVTELARSTKGEYRLWALLSEYLPSGEAADYNQALMELGALICMPRAPKCDQCPVADSCLAYALGVQEQRPVKKRKPPVPHHTVTAAVIRRNGHILIAQRENKGLLGGMWEFPGGKQEPGESLPECLRREICEELGVEVEVGAPLGVYDHAYSHFKITLHAFDCTLLKGEPQLIDHASLQWVVPSAFNDYPMGKIDRQIAANIQHSTGN